METCFFSCKKNTAYKNSSVRRTNKIRLMLLSTFTACGKKKARRRKSNKASRL